MKLKIEKDDNQKELVIVIRCANIDAKIEKLVETINSFYLTIIGKLNNEEYVLNIDEIYYFDAVDNRVFAYLENDVYEVNYKILELTELLKTTAFIQISRTVILNIRKIAKISQLVNGRMLAYLDNGEKVIISRAYAQEFKKKING